MEVRRRPLRPDRAFYRARRRERLSAGGRRGSASGFGRVPILVGSGLGLVLLLVWWWVS